MADAFISWQGLMAKDIFDTHGKLACLWFDNLILGVPEEAAIAKTLDHVVAVDKMSRKVADLLNEIWVPVQRVLPSWKWDAKLWENADSRISSVAVKTTVEATEAQYPNATEGEFWHEVAWASLGLTRSVVTWTALVAKSPCNFLVDDRESRAIQELFATQAPAEFATFSEILSMRLPDLSAMPWEAVLELRRHKFVEDFRAKVSEIHRLSRSGDSKSAYELLCELERRDMVEIVRMSEPSPGRAIWRGIGSNLPLPIPFNPISAALSVNDIAKELEKEIQFGWLYFLLDFGDWQSSQTRR